MNATATTEIYTDLHPLALHDALPVYIGRAGAGDVAAVIGDAAPAGAQELGQQVETRRLAGAIRPDQGVNAVPAHVEIDVLDGDEARKFLRQPFGREDVIPAHLDRTLFICLPSRSVEHTSELQSLLRTSYAVYSL